MPPCFNNIVRVLVIFATILTSSLSSDSNPLSSSAGGTRIHDAHSEDQNSRLIRLQRSVATMGNRSLITLDLDSADGSVEHEQNAARLFHADASVDAAAIQINSKSRHRSDADDERRFEIDWQRDIFLKDGRHYRVISGSMHYFRIPRDYWRDRLKKAKAMGLNTIQSYILWSMHEPWPGEFDFERGNADFREFVRLAQEEGLNVILRIGPYICETTMGGLPPWLLMVDSHMKLRTSDESYMFWVTRWFNALLPLLKPLLYTQGGPVIWLQIENEYGSYSVCDPLHLQRLHSLARLHLGPEPVLTTVDGPTSSHLSCARNVTGFLRTVDFGPGDGDEDDPIANFDDLTSVQPRGPLVNSEFYSGWQDYWGETFVKVDAERFLRFYRKLMVGRAGTISVNVYVFHGGTNFGFSSAAYGEPWSPVTTSYDYDAPVSEEGDTTRKYFAIREFLARVPNNNRGSDAAFPDVPANATKFSMGKLPVKFLGSVFDSQIRSALNSEFFVRSEFPLTFEQMWLDYGFLLYEHVLASDFRKVLLKMGEIRDRAYVFLNETIIGILSRLRKNDATIEIPVLRRGDKLGILIENQARYGNTGKLNESKGIVGNVTLRPTEIGSNNVEPFVLTNWTMYPIPLNETNSLRILPGFSPGVEKRVRLPGFFHARFVLAEGIVTNSSDTFFKFDNWGKGVLFVNGRNLGRYWPAAGPQRTLYVPGPFLKQFPEENEALIFELERFSPACHKFCYLESVDRHEIIGR